MLLTESRQRLHSCRQVLPCLVGSHVGPLTAPAGTKAFDSLTPEATMPSVTCQDRVTVSCCVSALYLGGCRMGSCRVG